MEFQSQPSNPVKFLEFFCPQQLQNNNLAKSKMNLRYKQHNSAIANAYLMVLLMGFNFM